MWRCVSIWPGTSGAYGGAPSCGRGSTWPLPLTPWPGCWANSGTLWQPIQGKGTRLRPAGGAAGAQRARKARAGGPEAPRPAKRRRPPRGTQARWRPPKGNTIPNHPAYPAHPWLAGDGVEWARLRQGLRPQAIAPTAARCSPWARHRCPPRAAALTLAGGFIIMAIPM